MTLPNTSYLEGERPHSVGILAMEMYFPKRCVSEAELEVHDGVSHGKYTVGLGQQYMAFTDDREDINSFALSAVSSLLRKYDIDPKSIGRLEIGTETLVDKSKSVKTTLMDLFASSGNFDIEGVDSKNACYGSTAALFNAINWVESRSWDGRNAIVFAGDIAVYDKGNARAVGGAGGCAMLIGPNAPIVIEPLHSTYMVNAYDFYKPRPTSEYPIVDGQGSIDTYLKALDWCYRRLQEKAASPHPMPTVSTFPSTVSLESFDYHIFHSPYGKLVQKGYARLLFHDYRKDPANPIFEPIRQLGISSDTPLHESLNNKTIEKAFMTISKSGYELSVAPSMACAKRLGNLYTGSLYGGLASLLGSVPAHELIGKRVLMFAFGGGAAASMYAIRVAQSPDIIVEKMDLLRRLESMRVTSVEEYDTAMDVREKNHGKCDYTPAGSTNDLFDGAFYLQHIDEKYRRSYRQKPL
ncbi:hydroxymethylglutaryl-CoA synthase [Ceratobasidium sp. AG-Ba]|nr:hydroxymethylglutaryl-CoA synthase [Ceratobasidium sp. AG-Ba]QRW02417.1 hydroxymethylglutaryl-CoA synthase [Ceratobasidium sp. AG-Ba]